MPICWDWKFWGAKPWGARAIDVLMKLRRYCREEAAIGRKVREEAEVEARRVRVEDRIAAREAASRAMLNCGDGYMDVVLLK